MFNEESIVDAIHSLQNNQGLMVHKAISDRSFAVTKLDANTIRNLGMRFNVICPMMRDIFVKYSRHTEDTFFPVGTKFNDEFYVVYFQWQDELWGITSVPLKREFLCRLSAEQVGCRLADGVPVVLAAPNTLHDPTTLVDCMPFEFAVQLAGVGAAKFPLHSRSTFTLEPRHDQPGPVMAIYVKKATDR